jgi:hypothetical protein
MVFTQVPYSEAASTQLTQLIQRLYSTKKAFLVLQSQIRTG